jgi:hypothetical protein
VPEGQQADVTVPGQPAGIRYFPRDARHVADFVRDYMESLERERVVLAGQGRTGPLPPSSFLAISGGGDNGAFGAGLLKGWSKSGSRPVFKIVTGVSTGALLAPFAFLGPAYDDRLKSLYTEISMKNVATAQVFIYPGAIQLHELVPRERTLYIIRNVRLDPEWGKVDRRTLSIAFRAITSLIQSQGMGDLYRIYAIAQRDHVAYRLAYIPATFQTPHLSDFDPSYMKALYSLGQNLAERGYQWETSPPVLVSGMDDATDRNLQIP